MPVLKSQGILDIGRGLSTFFKLEAGVGRNGKLSFDQNTAMKRELDQARAKIAEQGRQIRQLRRRLSDDKKPARKRRERLEARSFAADSPVFFVMRQVKSGTGWLRRMLDLHPEVLCKGEGSFSGRDKRNEKLVDTKAGNRVV